MIHQLTHITRDRGSLYHDDRLDALALALGFIVENVGVSNEDALERYREEMLDKDLEDFMNGIGIGGRAGKPNFLNSFTTLA